MSKARRKIAILAMAGVLVLSACGDREREINLRNVRSTGEGPEEFGIVPAKPLELPTNLAELPEPTPGGQNRTDQRPVDDAIAALGGSPAQARESGAVPTSDSILVAQAGRFGRDPNIRATLAEEDLDFRRRKSLFTWQLFPSDEYNRAYSAQRLDPYIETNRFRRAGVQTPAAPPEGVEF